VKRTMTVTYEREIIGYVIYLAKSENDLRSREEFYEPTIEAALSTAFRLCFERFETPPILSDGALDDLTFIQIGYKGIQSGQPIYGTIQAYTEETKPKNAPEPSGSS
jgi:hypothetical protein